MTKEELAEVIGAAVHVAVREATGEYKVPRKDWLKIAGGIIACCTFLGGITFYIFTPSQVFASHVADEKVSWAVQKMFNAQMVEIKEDLKKKADKKHVHKKGN